MQPDFVARPDGILEVRLNEGAWMIEEALNDAVGSQAPRGAVHAGLSTYWLDQTEAALLRSMSNGIDEPFAAGNVTYLRVLGDQVIAGYDFDPDEAEAQSITVNEFLSMLRSWRQAVIDAGGVSGSDAALVVKEPPRPMGPGDD